MTDDPRADALAAYRAALRAADPYEAVRRVFARGDVDVGSGEVRVVAIGKASIAMARAIVDELGSRARGVVVAPSESAALGNLRVLRGSHPIPDASSIAAGEAVLDVAKAGAGPLLVALSGGASALADVPLAGLSVDDLRVTNDALLRSGAPIGEVNAVRKHLSALKGGRLAVAARSAVVALVLSDVVDAPLDAVGSGPTLPDPSTWRDVADIVRSRSLAIGEAVRALVERGVRGQADETPKPGDPRLASSRAIVVGDAHLAAEAAAAEAKRRGYDVVELRADLHGDAESIARDLARRAASLASGSAIVLAGESTVVVRGRGHGGRNQQLALAFALAAEGRSDVTLAALATDGIDGPTDAAGAIVDGATAGRIREHGVDPARALEENDAHPALDGASALVRVGATGTNVNDLVVLLRRA